MHCFDGNISPMKPKIIYVLFHRSSFVEVDIAILSKRYDVLINMYAWRKSALVPFFMFHQILVLLKNVFSVKLIMVSSGGYWSIVPSVFGKLFSIPVFIILNGSDCASLPLVNYGNLRKFGLRNVCKFSFAFADMLLPVSESLVFTKNTYYDKDVVDYQGYKHYFPSIKTFHQVVFNGLDGEFWKKDEAITKEKNSFMAVFSPGQYLLKGGDLIASVAPFFPDCTFYLGGVDPMPEIMEKNPNVHFLGSLKAWELKQYYSKSQFHFQLSIFEGFGCTLAEAMLCECIPIGSVVNIIPQIIGDTGYILKHRDVELLKILITEALGNVNKKSLGEKARKRIIDNFSIEIRAQQLFSLMKQKIAFDPVIGS